MTGIAIKRAYDEASPEDGFRLLVDRLWPRGLTKEETKIGLWLKDVAPSADLRHWLGHNPARWPEFEDRYRAELADNPAMDELLALSENINGRRCCLRREIPSTTMPSCC